jgi:dipeptidyl aminopeptidase/acylaminoacyl peptidase
MLGQLPVVIVSSLRDIFHLLFLTIHLPTYYSERRVARFDDLLRIRATRLSFTGISVGLMFTVACQNSASSMPQSESEGTRVTLPDIFRKKDIGAVLLDSNGQRLVFELIPSVAEALQFGGGELCGNNGVPKQLYVYDISTGAQPRRLLTSTQDIDGERAISFSPNGSRLALQWIQHGELKMGIFTFESGELLELHITPAIAVSPTADKNIVWISEDELVLSSVSSDEPALGTMVSRVYAGRKIYHAWEDAWSGRRSTADVIDSHVGYPHLPARTGRLLIANIRTGTLQTIAEGVYFALSLSPNGRYLAAAQQGGIQQPDPQQPLAMETYRSSDRRRYDAVLLDLKGHSSPRHLAVGSQLRMSNSTWAWNSRSDMIAFFVADSDKRWDQGHFILYDVQRGAGQAVSTPGLSQASPLDPFGWDYDPVVPFGPGIAIPALHHSDAKGTARVDWFIAQQNRPPRNLTRSLRNVSPKWVESTGTALFVLADGQIWRVPLQGRSSEITAGLKGPLTIPAPYPILSTLNSRRNDSRDNSTNVVAQFDDGNELALINLNKTSIETLGIPANYGTPLAASVQHRMAILLRRNDPDLLMGIVGTNGEVKDIITLNRHLDAITPRRSVIIRYKTSDGQDAVSTALMPDDWHPGRRVPMILDVYPSVNSPPSLVDFSAETADLFTSMGYAVLYPYSPLDRLQKGDDALGNWGDYAERAADAFIQAGYGDSERMGVWGLSWGGSAALAVVEQSNRFKAVVVQSAVSVDLISAYADEIGWIDTRAFPYDYFPSGAGINEGRWGPFHLDGPPWDALPKAIASSPLFKVDRIHAPVMLIYSDLDVYSMNQGDELFGALFRMRKEAQYIRYWGEGHNLRSPANTRDYWSRQFAWFDRWLDITRRSDGTIIYDQNRATSRGTSASWSPADFLKQTWFFGPEIGKLQQMPVAAIRDTSSRGYVTVK